MNRRLMSCPECGEPLPADSTGPVCPFCGEEFDAPESLVPDDQRLVVVDDEPSLHIVDDDTE